jgi:hypothetical protein
MYPINQISAKTLTTVHTRVGFKPSEPIAPIWAPSWIYLVLAIHTTKHSRFDRELHWAPHPLSRPWGEQFLVVEIYIIKYFIEIMTNLHV